MIYWVIYDITKNRNRKKISDLCKDYGLERMQYSSFVGVLTKNKAEMLAIEVQRFLTDNDKLFIMPTGKDEFSKHIILGNINLDEIVKTKEVIFVG